MRVTKIGHMEHYFTVRLYCEVYVDSFWRVCHVLISLAYSVTICQQDTGLDFRGACMVNVLASHACTVVPCNLLPCIYECIQYSSRQHKRVNWLLNYTEFQTTNHYQWLSFLTFPLIQPKKYAATLMPAYLACDISSVLFMIALRLQQAIETKSYMAKPIRIQKGDTSEAFNSSDCILEGQLHIGGQEHFYLETQSCIAVPKGEDGEMEVFYASQGANRAQVCACFVCSKERSIANSSYKWWR